MKQLTEGSLFAGIGGWTIACAKFGVKSLWASEIDPFPIEVMQRHFPDVEQVGDINKLSGFTLPPVDILTAGSPCQDLSVAGKREGLTGERSGLFVKAVQIFREMREATNGRYPRYFIWENVPGALSSNRGLDFKAVLEAITEAEVPVPPSKKWAAAGMVRGEKCELAWRILDAQYWGVPQRRRRIFLVADFGGSSAAKILFKPEKLPGYLEARKDAWERAAVSAEAGTPQAGTPAGEEDVTANAFALCSKHSNGMNSDSPYGMSYETAKSRTLDCNGGNPACNQGGMLVVSKKSECFEEGSPEGVPRMHGDIAPTLKAQTGGQRKPCVLEKTEVRCFEPRSQDGVPRLHGTISPTLNTMQGGQRQPCVYMQETRVFEPRSRDRVPRVGGTVVPTLTSNQGGGQRQPCIYTEQKAASADTYCVQGSIIDRKDKNGAQGKGWEEDVSFTLNTKDRHVVAGERVIGSLCADDYKGVNNQLVNQGKLHTDTSGVRRLTPLECERLQGLPDNWTAPGSDARRYRAIGNGMAQPCPDFVIGSLVREVELEEAPHTEEKEI